jgi:heptosyltransferase-3
MMKFLVYTTGSLGDTLTTVPALWSIRNAHPEAEITLLYNLPIESHRLSAEHILSGSGLIDHYIPYRARPHRASSIHGLRVAWDLLRVLRRTKPDAVFYLIRAFRGEPRVRRDKLFFRVSGVPRVWGFQSMIDRPPAVHGAEEPVLPQLADLHLRRVAESGLRVPPPGCGRSDLGLTVDERQQAVRWLRNLTPLGSRRLVALGAGSNMQSKRWSEQGFEAVVNALVKRYNVWPVVFGGHEDAELAERLTTHWGCGTVAAGHLTVRQAAAVLEHCALYLGNDTGTMHLAAAMKVACVAIFSARDYRGLWEPYGQGHVVLRRQVSCALCFSTSCPVPGHPCLSGIGSDEVLRKCEEKLMCLMQRPSQVPLSE